MPYLPNLRRPAAARPPPQVDWAGRGVEVALECSGKFLTRAKLQPFFDKVGARAGLPPAGLFARLRLQPGACAVRAVAQLPPS